MPDTTLLHLLTGHTVRTTTTVQAALDALKPAALPDSGLAKPDGGIKAPDHDRPQ